MQGRSIQVSRADDGGVRIDGQDLGSAVESIMGAGMRECEWSWTIGAADVPAAVEALGGAPGTDPVRLLEAWSAAHRGRDPGQAIHDAGVPMGFWSRFGD